MTQTPTTRTGTRSGTETAVKPTAGKDLSTGTASAVLVSEHGKTTIADLVVSKIAGIATREVAGVYDLGGTAARAVGMLRDRIPGSRTNLSQGVSVEVGETQAAIDLQIIAEYGVSIADLAQGIRRNVITAIEQMTSLEVTEVNIAVGDIHLEGDDDHDTDAEDAAPIERRVQ
ncbi:Asp23/Gls24 family envelope stress response protein [Kribbella qitaiheensis]|uniref:Asp23/Gls24 family envelope stress response protein n=1 Tax=Kribbella qitaiheensis TaxID=1544730 RepID=A0A7G6WWC0_9ACTN|nr:Asp23/Gls24 family envelope stress response protein [Kribbella qitaiheensis]QNE18285.1 Asp23/Gls24 family envelope stress response protein [Kribbella qitaiheensis]